MLDTLLTKNIGPIAEMKLSLAERINIFTGDNGLGKTFILDIAWWALTGKWARQVNPKLNQSYMVKPMPPKQGKIGYSYAVQAGAGHANYHNEAEFSHKDQTWQFLHFVKNYAGIVIYALADGSFAVWDTVRNTQKYDPNVPLAYIFSTQEIWDGLKSSEGKPLCNGLIADWASWQKEKNVAFESLCEVLRRLSPLDEQITAGKLTRIDLYDTRDMPTIRMPYNDDIPVVYASSAIKRVLSLAYCLIWAIEEHKRACELLNIEPAFFVTFLIDELEAHLHPKWQRSIMESLIAALDYVRLLEVKNANVSVDPIQQILMVTHSPLLLTSMEDIFNSSTDSWFDINLDDETKNVTIEKKKFIKQGSASYWYTSEAFDLETDYSRKKEALLERISKFTDNDSVDTIEASAITREMYAVLPDIDILWPRWRAYCAEKGISV